MALISKACMNPKKKIKLELSADILEQIQAYCEWSGIDDMGFFLEEAACYVFAKDKDWKVEQKRVKRSIRAKKKTKEVATESV